jgi:prolipoprotein diacylglyceryl transferase
MLALKFTWNPITGIDLGFITIHFYSLMFVVAFGLGYYIMKPIFKREGIPLEKLDSLFIYAVVAILIGMRLGHVLFYQTELLWEDPLAVLLPIKTVGGFEFTGFRGLASHGAVVGVLIAMVYYNRKVLKSSWLWILDRMVVPTAIGAMFVRLGNFFNSEMVGKVIEDTESPLAFQFVQDYYSKGDAIAITGIRKATDAYQALNGAEYVDKIAAVPFRYPGQLMEAIGYFFVFVILFVLYWKTEVRKKSGFLLGLFLLLLMTVRFIVEGFKREQVEGREDWILGLNTGQILSIPFILMGLYLVFRALTRKPELS